MPRAAGLALAAALAPFAGTGLAAGPAAAQTRASLEAGVSHVEYDGFLPSAAFSLSPSFALASKRLGFAGHATWLQFESGNSSIQGLVAGSLFLPVSAGTVVELGAELGGSRYEEFARFSRVLGRARLRFREVEGTSGWVDATVGAAVFDSEGEAVEALAAGLRLENRDVALTLAGAVTVVGDAGYADFEGGFHHTRPGGFTADVVLSVRAGDPGGDLGPYIEAALTFPLTSHVAVVLGGGRYAADAVRGTIAGRYVSAGLRIAAPVRRRLAIVLTTPNDSLASGEGTVAAALVEVRRGRGETCTLVFRAASAVEVMADFTDWVPTALKPAGTNRWSITLPISPGRHRLNVRVSGGPWSVPAGTTPVADDFQGMVGAVVIP